MEINLILGEEKPRTEFNAVITWPLSGLAVSEIDFPLNIKIEVTNPKQIAKIDVFAKKDGKEIFLGKVDPAGNEDMVLLWRKPKDGGSYELYGKAYGWGGELRETNKTIIIYNKK